MVKPLTVYKASAGSGKTFALAVQYIKLVVQNPQAYRNILAVTFTNKATEEMKTRILSQLYGIWKQLPDSDIYMQEVCQKLDASPEFVSQRAGIALELLLHNYNHFRVMTIDTFFQSVLRNLAHELDLTANLRIGLNDSQVEEMAVDQMLDDLKTTDVMLQWILKYIMENISDDRSWNVIGQIKQFGKTIFRDYYKDVSKQLNERLQHEGFFDQYAQTLQDIRQTAKERMLNIAESFFGTLEEEGLTADDLAQKRRGIAGFFYKLQNGIFDESIENQTVANCLGNPTKWYTKTHPRRELIHELADGPLGEILRYAVEERPRQWRLYQSATLTLRHMNQVRLLSSIENKVRELNDSANRFLLSDTQKLLNALISDSDSPFIFEKIGTQLEHIMIDEFQDTSTVQWQNFRILLQEAMSHQGSENLIVGDVKQSIYRWRSGDWRLLNDIEQQFPKEMIQTEMLKVNRRSERFITQFNNAFFTEAAKLEYDKLQETPEADQLKRAYSEVKQEIPLSKPQTGFVRVELLTAEDYQQQTLSRITEILQGLISQGIPQDKMAILVRTNSFIPVIAKYMAEHAPDINIVSDEAFRLDASQPVNILMQALRLIVHPHDQLARAFIEKTVHTTFDDERCTKYKSLSLYELAERLFADLRLSDYGEQSAYLCAFFDQLRQYTAENAGTIEDFLRLWDNEICSKTIQSDITNGVRIISIHKSKGLEFDHVLCPFCDWQLEKSGNILWCKPNIAPFNELPIAPIDYSQKGMTGTIYEEDYHNEHLQNVVDNLNLLYVAFTRARSSLFVIGRRGAKKSRSEIIELTLPLLNEGRLTGLEDVDQPLVYEYGTPTASRQEMETKKTANVFLQPSDAIHVTVTTNEVKTEFRQSNQSREFINGDDEQAGTSYIQLGSILHRIFSVIRTKDDIGTALHQLEAEGIIYDDVVTLERISTMLRQRLEHPKVAEWFSGRWTLFNECTILSMEDGEVKEHRPDRVMTDGKEWIVVDFKFGRQKNDYPKQVRNYMNLLKTMGHTEVKGYLWYVYSNIIEEV